MAIPSADFLSLFPVSRFSDNLSFSFSSNFLFTLALPFV